MSDQVADNNYPKEALSRTKQKFDSNTSVGPNLMLTFMNDSSQSITPWGTNVQRRDKELREFWPTESFLAGTISNVVLRNSAFEWVVESESEALQEALTNMLNSALSPDGTFGWISFIMNLSVDLYTQDNGAFIEVIRATPKKEQAPETAPVIGISLLDSNACQRTGNPKFPVLYTNTDGVIRKLPWYSVVTMVEMPSPMQSMKGVGVCAVSRILRLAEIMKSIEIFKDEKIGGRNHKSVNIVSGVSRTELADTMQAGQENANNRGQMRYMDPVILASLDPSKPVSSVTLDLAGLPDGFNFDEEMRWYISGLANGFGIDYQDLAPLPGGGIGSSNQSEILDKKSRAKGPAVFMQQIETIFKNYGIIPEGATFKFIAKDQAEKLADAELDKVNAEKITILRRGGLIDSNAGRAMLERLGVVDEDIIAAIPDDFGNDMFSGGNDPKQMLGDTGANTVAEDAKRVEKFLSGGLRALLGR